MEFQGWQERTVANIQRLKQALGTTRKREQILARIMGWAQELRKHLDEVIVTRLPQFRDVVETQHDSSAERSSMAAKDQETLADAHDEHAGWAAANAFNPVPGLDVGLDLQLLNSLSRSLAAAYGLSEEQSTAHRMTYPAVHQFLERIAPRLAQGTVAVALRSVGLELLARETAKWVPLAGNMVAAVIGYRLVRRFGENLRCQYEASALRRNAAIRQATHSEHASGQVVDWSGCCAGGAAG
jgi:hypothetical protein